MTIRTDRDGVTPSTKEPRALRSAPADQAPGNAVDVIRGHITATRQAADGAATAAAEAQRQITELRHQIETQARELSELRQAQVRSGRLGVGGGGAAVRALGDLLGEALRGAAPQGQTLAHQVGAGSRVRLSHTVDMRVMLGASKRALELGSTQLGALVPIMYDPDVADRVRQRAPRMLDVIPVIPTTSNTVRVRYKSQHASLWAYVATASLSGATSLVVNNARGFFAGQTITVGTGGTADTVFVSAVSTSTNTLTVGAMTNAHSVNDDVTSDRFIFTPETTLKPRAKVAYSSVDVAVETQATIVKITRQSLDDIPMLSAELEMELPDNLRRQIEVEMLYGPQSTTGRWGGIMTNTSRLTHSRSSIAGDTIMDAIHRAITLIRLQNQEPTAIVVHPSDAEEFALLKDSTGRYLDYFRDGQMWRLPVIETEAIVEGQALVGDFARGCRMYDRQTAATEFFEQDEDNIQKNLVTVRSELRAAFAVKVPTAFCDVTL